MKSQKQQIFKFVCACNCGQLSDELGKDYIRLLSGEKWFAKGCQPTEGKPFKSGFIVRQENGEF